MRYPDSVSGQKAKKTGLNIAMNLDYAPPPPDLAEYVSAFYLFEAEQDELRDIERADVAQFRVVLDGSADMIHPDGSLESFGRASIFGPRQYATTVVGKGPKMRLFGCGILPAGWAISVRRPASECANHVFRAADVMDADLDGYIIDLARCSTLAEMVDLTSGLARPYFVERSDAPFWFIRAVNSWLEATLVPELDDLEAATGLSRRQVERLCKQHYGAPPKFLMRKYRALRAANAIANGDVDWQDFIDGCFYDQSHFIRDIKEFTGMTPGAIRDRKSPLSIMTFGRASLEGDVGHLVSAT